MPAPDDLAPVYFRVSPSIWRQKWSESARYLALYLLTCQHRNNEGFFVMPFGYAYGDLKWSPEAFAEPFDELLGDGFVQYDVGEEVMLIPKALDYQSPTNPNMVKAAIKRVKTVPPTDLDAHFLAAAKRYCKPLAEALREALPERFGKPQHCSTQHNTTAGADANDGPKSSAPADQDDKEDGMRQIGEFLSLRKVTA